MLRKWCALALFLVGSSIAGGQTPQDQSAQKTIAVFGSTIRYTETGSGPTVVLLHGLGGDATNWAPTVPVLATRFHVIALDQIGFGASDKPHVPYSVGTLVDFLHGFLIEKRVARASLVGNSLGGWTAAYFTLAHPDMVDRLVLASAAGVCARVVGRQPLDDGVAVAVEPLDTGRHPGVLEFLAPRPEAGH